MLGANLSEYAKVTTAIGEGCLRQFPSNYASIAAPFDDGRLKQFLPEYKKLQHLVEGAWSNSYLFCICRVAAAIAEGCLRQFLSNYAGIAAPFFDGR